MSTNLKADEKTVSGYLSTNDNGFLCIPYTQRKYEWKDSQIKRLLHDITMLYENKKDCHILNFFTLLKVDKDEYIYDGQQRTVTLSIIICVISNLMREYGLQQESNKLKRCFIIDKPYNGPRETKLKFNNEQLQTYYQVKIIRYDEEGNSISSPVSYQVTEEMRSLDNCYGVVNEFFEDYYEGKEKEKKVEILSTFADLILRRILLIKITVNNEETAEQMFEALNNTGKELEALYVTKSICVNVAGEDETKKRWEEIEYNLEELKKDDFLTQFVTIFHGKTTKNKAVDTLKALGMLNNRESVIQTLENMQKVSRTFLFLNRPDRGLTEWNDKRFKKQMNNLYIKAEEMKALKGKQYMPVIHTMYLHDFNIDYINTVFDWLIKLHIRNITLGGDNPNTLEKIYPELAKSLNDACKEAEKKTDKLDKEFQEQQVQKIIDKIQSKIKSDEMVKNCVPTKDFTDSSIARFILGKIYEFENGTELQISTNTANVNLEHILPKKPELGSDWYELFGEDMQEYLNKLGNLTVFSSPKNSAVKNKSFSYKKEHYQLSQIPQNNVIGKYDEWNKEIIKERTKALSEQIVKIWGI